MAMLVLAQGWCPMCPMGPWDWIGMIVAALVGIAFLSAVIWLVYRMLNGPGSPSGGQRGDRAADALRERYARGEIDRETYDRMLEDLRRGRAA